MPVVPLCAPSEALPPPVSLMPRVDRLLLPLRVLVEREPVDREVREEVAPVAAPDVFEAVPMSPLPAISYSSSLSDERILSFQSVIWSLRLLI